MADERADLLVRRGREVDVVNLELDYLFPTLGVDVVDESRVFFLDFEFLGTIEVLFGALEVLVMLLLALGGILELRLLDL